MEEESCSLDVANNCAICLEVVKQHKEGRIDGCCHSFCFACILEWSKVTNTCPLCKSRFTALYKGNDKSSPLFVNHKEQSKNIDEAEAELLITPYLQQTRDSHQTSTLITLDDSFINDEDEEEEEEENEEVRKEELAVATQVFVSSSQRARDDRRKQQLHSLKLRREAQRERSRRTESVIQIEADEEEEREEQRHHEWYRDKTKKEQKKRELIDEKDANTNGQITDWITRKRTRMNGDDSTKRTRPISSLFRSCSSSSPPPPRSSSSTSSSSSSSYSSSSSSSGSTLFIDLTDSNSNTPITPSTSSTTSTKTSTKERVKFKNVTRHLSFDEEDKENCTANSRNASTNASSSTSKHQLIQQHKFQVVSFIRSELMPLWKNGALSKEQYANLTKQVAERYVEDGLGCQFGDETPLTARPLLLSPVRRQHVRHLLDSALDETFS
ncbi:PHD and RING finger domain-containing protein 1 [Balamuthia mandrillaris]